MNRNEVKKQWTLYSNDNVIGILLNFSLFQLIGFGTGILFGFSSTVVGSIFDGSMVDVDMILGCSVVVLVPLLVTGVDSDWFGAADDAPKKNVIPQTKPRVTHANRTINKMSFNFCDFISRISNTSISILRE